MSDAAAIAGAAEAHVQKPAAAETNALNLRWCFGFNSSVASTVHSLSSPTRHALFYVCAHTGVLHDLTHAQQYLLQGHCNPITSVCVSRDKRWVATADFGPDAMLVVWDALTATPVKTLSVWEWPANALTPAISAPVGHRDYQHCVRFNPVDVRDLVSNGAKEVIFWNWSDSSIAAFHPPRGISKLKKAVRTLSQSTFIPYTTKAVTATTSGHIIAWDYPVSELVQATGRDAVKILKLVKSGINLLDTVLDKFLVCGCADGAVRFFDFQFRVVAWFEDVQAGHITSISFADQALSPAAAGGAQPGAQAGQVSMEEFSVPEFVVGTSSGKVVQLDSKTMEQLTADKRRGKVLVQGFDDEVHALDAHPSLPLFAVGTTRGSLQLWDVDDRKMVAYRKFEAGEASSATAAAAERVALGLAAVRTPGTLVQGSGGLKTDVSAELARASAAAKGPPPKDELINDSSSIQCLKFGPRGALLAVGFANGFVKVVSSAEAAASAGMASGAAGDGQFSSTAPLRDVCSFHRSEQAITSLVFSADGSWLGTSDAQGCVAVYRYWHKDDELDKALEWIYVGKYRAHYRPIISLFFEEASAAQPAAAAAAQHKDDDQSPPGTASSARGGTRNNLAALSAATSAALASHSASHNASRGVPRLFSLGEDRILQEYDLAHSSIRAGLKISSSTRMEQTACPTAMMSLPGRSVPAAAGRPAHRTPDLIITANDEYKLKVWEMTTPGSRGAGGATGSLKGGAVGASLRKPPAKAAPKKLGKNGKPLPSGPEDPTAGMSPSELEEYNRDKKCRKTLLAPLYGGSINKLFNLPRRDASGASGGKSGIVPSDFLVYSTFDKLVGLIKLPLDGNPTKSMALIAHPGEVAAVCATYDGKYLLTAGGADRAVNLWAVAPQALEASITLGGKGIDPYLSLIDGGREGAFYQELLDYFYFAQLRQQGLATTAPRRITGYITVDEAVTLMRALGFYPTEQQVVAMKAEVRFENQALAESRAAAAAAASPANHASAAAAALASRSPDLLSLDEFLKLYVNHRPVFGLGARAFEAAFASLGARAQRGHALSAETLVHQLMTMGDEPMSAAELEHCLDALLGERFVPEDAQDVEGRTDLTGQMKRILSRLPAQIAPQRFAQDILGFEDYSAAAGGAGGAAGAPALADEFDPASLPEEGEQEEEKEQHTAGHAASHSIVISHAQ